MKVYCARPCTLRLLGYGNDLYVNCANCYRVEVHAFDEFRSDMLERHEIRFMTCEVGCGSAICRGNLYCCVCEPCMPWVLGLSLPVVQLAVGKIVAATWRCFDPYRLPVLCDAWQL